MKARFGIGFLSNVLSTLSLSAFTFLLWPRKPRFIVHQVGPDLYDLAALVWLLGAVAGALLFLWSRRTNPKVTLGITGLLALAAVLTVVVLMALR